MDAIIVTNGTAEEITALALAVQKRQFSEEGPIRLTAEEADHCGLAKHEQLHKTP